MVCVTQTTKKYTTRPGPPYPAQDCAGEFKNGNDGLTYESKVTSSGVYRWVKSKGSSRKVSKKKSSRKAPRKKSSRKAPRKKSSRKAPRKKSSRKAPRKKSSRKTSKKKSSRRTSKKKSSRRASKKKSSRKASKKRSSRKKPTGLAAMTVTELKKKARERGLSGYSTLRKAELVKLLQSRRKVAGTTTVAELKTQCKKKGITGYSKLDKAKLITKCRGTSRNTSKAVKTKDTNKYKKLVFGYLFGSDMHETVFVENTPANNSAIKRLKKVVGTDLSISTKLFSLAEVKAIIKNFTDSGAYDVEGVVVIKGPINVPTSLPNKDEELEWFKDNYDATKSVNWSKLGKAIMTAY